MSYRQRIINIDFDDTICHTPSGAPWGSSAQNGFPLRNAQEAIRSLKAAGYYVIIWTARYLDGDIEDVRAFLEKYDIPYDKINEPCDGLQYKSWPKVFCDTQIDDNSLLNVDWRFIPYHVHLRDVMAGERGSFRGLLPIVTGEMAEYYYYRTVEHVKRVVNYCEKFMIGALALGIENVIDVVVAQDELRKRAETHDADKFGDDLAIPYILLTDKMRCKFGRRSWDPIEDHGKPDQERALLDAVNEVIESAVRRHRENNKHHPDYWVAGPGLQDMDAISFVEMCADWCAMSEENRNDPTEFFEGRVLEKYHWSVGQVSKIRTILDVMWQVV